MVDQGKKASLASSQQLANLVDMRNKAAVGPVGGEADDLLASQKEWTGANEESQHGEPATRRESVCDRECAQCHLTSMALQWNFSCKAPGLCAQTFW